MLGRHQEWLEVLRPLRHRYADRMGMPGRNVLLGSGWLVRLLRKGVPVSDAVSTLESWEMEDSMWMKRELWLLVVKKS